MNAKKAALKVFIGCDVDEPRLGLLKVACKESPVWKYVGQYVRIVSVDDKRVWLGLTEQGKMLTDKWVW